ncbi:hypothetical protein ABCR94_34150 [Streptomyces sp. 21So2-11]|uniref:hypothetical protein n=1 Tax=Streptomyces sp. 21So2-11 TaxID=3144408 RepID=UPI00321C17EE
MHHNSAHRRRRKTTASSIGRLLRWASARRRAASGLMLRGACYGAGTTAVSLIAVWAERHI